MNAEDSINQLLCETKAHLGNVVVSRAEDTQRDLVMRFIDDLHIEIMQSRRLSRQRSRNARALTCAPSLLEAEHHQYPALFEAALGAFAYARWDEFYEETPWSNPFLARFATGECLGPTGRFESARLILGLFILGPHTHYPAHAHEAEEFYVVVSGEADFQVGANGNFVTKRQGDVVLHASDVSHAIRTASRAMLAIYGWRGALDGPSWYRDDMTDEHEPKKFPTFSIKHGL